MPDDEHLGGTRDPHESGRRHRREEPPAEEDKPRRRRRSMEAGGGLSVADLVQKHTASRSDLTPVSPDHLQQNTLMSGRRARKDRQNADGPTGRGHPGEPPRRQAPPPTSIADALEGAPDFPRDDTPRTGRRAARPTFPQDEAPRRPRRATDPHPVEAARNGRRAAGNPASSGTHSAPAAYPGEPTPRGHAAPEPPAFPHEGHRLDETAAHTFPAQPGSPGHRAADPTGHSLNEPHGHAYPDHGAPNGHRAGDNFAEPATGGHRAGEPSGHALPDHSTPASRQMGEDAYPDPAAPANRRPNDPAGLATPNGRRPGEDPFLDSAAPGNRRTNDPATSNGRRAGEDPFFDPAAPGNRAGDPATANGRRPGEDPFFDSADPGSRRAGEDPFFDPADPGSRRAGDPAAPNGRRAGEDPFLDSTPPGNRRASEPTTPDGRRASEDSFFDSGSRRADEVSGGHAFPDPGRRAGEAAGHGLPDPAAPRGRRTGETSAPRPHPGEAARNGRRAGEASAHLPIPGESPAFPRAGEVTDLPPIPGGRRPGEASAHHPVPGDIPSPSPRPRPRRGGRRAGEASAPLPMPGDGFPPEGPRNGRRADETAAHLPADGFPPAGPRRGREASAHRPVPGEAAHPGDDPRNGRRPGEASAHHPMPGDGFPGDDTSLNGFPSEAPRGRRTETPGDGFPRDDAPRNGFPPEAPRRRAEAPHEGFPTEAPRGRRAETPGDGFPPDTRRGRDPHHPVAGENAHPGDAFPRDDTPRNGRRPGEASAHHPVPGRFPDDPRRQGPPTPPPGQWPGEPLSEPRLTPAAIDAPDGRPLSSGVPPVPMPLPPRGGDDLVSMTTEMEAIGEEVQKRRTIDHTLARFSAVHDELKAEEREKKAKRRKLRPWQADDDEMDRLDEMDAQQSMAMRIPSVPDEDDEPEEDEKPTRRKKLRDKLRGRSAGKAFVVFFAALVFVSTATAWGFKSYVEAGAQTVDALDPDSQAIQDAEAQRGDENFLLVGSDTRSGAAAGDGVGDEKEVQGARSDTVMIAHIPRDRQRVVVVSFPRDLEVTRPACEGWDADTGELNGEQHQAEELVKLNTAYQVGGPKCVTKLVQELSGLAINHFVGIDFHGFKDMVDAVQGVEVCVERPMKDEILGTVVPQAGKNVKLTGDQALNFVRARHVEGDVTSDYGRITRQQRFLSSLLRKAMSSEVLLNPGKLTDFVDAFSGATFGDNIGVDQLFTLGQSMQGVVAGRVTFITVPTVGEANDRNNEELRAEDNAALFEAIRQDAPLPGEAPEKKPADDASKDTAKASTLAQDQPQGPVDPRTVKIQVLNGGNETGGIAGDTADALAEQGFQIMRVDSAPEAIDKPAVVRFSKERAAEAQTVQAAIPGSVLQEDPSLAGAIMLVIGPGFDGEVVSPNGGGKPAEVPDNLSTVNAGDVSCA